MQYILVRERNDQVKHAFSGQAGLTAAEQDPPDLIVLDLTLPDHDGFEVYRRLRGNPSLQSIPVLLVESFSPERIYPTAQRLGVAGYLYEPYRIETLLAARDAVLKGDVYYPTLP